MIAEQRTVLYWEWAYVLLMQPWQDGQHARSPSLGSKQTFFEGHLLYSSLAQGISSSVVFLHSLEVGHVIRRQDGLFQGIGYVPSLALLEIPNRRIHREGRSVQH